MLPPTSSYNPPKCPIPKPTYIHFTTSVFDELKGFSMVFLWIEICRAHFLRVGGGPLQKGHLHKILIQHTAKAKLSHFILETIPVLKKYQKIFLRHSLGLLQSRDLVMRAPWWQNFQKLRPHYSKAIMHAEQIQMSLKSP